MAPTKQRGSKVIYVAASARELPQEVQDWLVQGGHRASPSANVYDALAVIATGRRPKAMIVSMEAVDWNEMEFFDHVMRLSRETAVYVTGQHHNQPKLQAAMARGARLFELDAVEADLTDPIDYPSAGTGGLLAGSLRTGNMRAAVPEPPPGPSVVLTEGEGAYDPEVAERPVVRLVTAPEHDPDEARPAVPFPWAPSPNRPQRTPPRPAQPAEPVSATPVPQPVVEPRRSPPAVRLTQDELQALLGGVPKSQAGSQKEQRP